MQIKDMMSRGVITVSPEDSLKDVGKILKEKRISGLPVVDSAGKIVGMITLTDLLKILSRIYHWREMEDRNPELKFSEMFEQEKSGAKVKDMMTKEVITLEEDSPLERVMELMFSRNVHTIPIITKSGELVGIVGKRDLACACF